MKLRFYQQSAKDEIYQHWNSGAQNVGVALATGSGKTVLFCNIIAEHPGHSIAIAHRVELVSQISLTLARHGIRHRIIAQKRSIRDIIAIHMNQVGKSYYDPQASVVVAGVDTLLRLPENTPWFKMITLVVQDEGHHPLAENKWGRAAALFPTARGLYPTATPVRADGKGLGRNADGILDALVLGVNMRELIDLGFLSDYRIFAPPSDLDLEEVPVGASGEYVQQKLRTAVHKSHITGDVVKQYLKIAPGKLGVTFAVDIDTAAEIAQAYRDSGVKAEVISSKTPDLLRTQIMEKFRNREIQQLVNVDILGEGVDVPAIEVVSMARPTNSFALYSQQFGRALRPLEGKKYAIIIDHVDNVLRHGLPDAPRVWSLDRRERRTRSTPDDVIPLKTCLADNCMAVYPRWRKRCPYCGHFTAPTSRAAPEFVDGDLLELDPEVLRELRQEIDRIDNAPKVPRHLNEIARRGLVKRHRERQDAQHELRSAIALWAGYYRDQGREDSEIYREFFLRFHVDIATAQTLNKKDANILYGHIQRHIDEMALRQ